MVIVFVIIFYHSYSYSHCVKVKSSHVLIYQIQLSFIHQFCCYAVKMINCVITNKFNFNIIGRYYCTCALIVPGKYKTKDSSDDNGAQLFAVENS